MPVSCDNTPLSGNNGRVMFQPPGGTYCLLDNTDFPVGTRITVPASNDFRVGDAVILRALRLCFFLLLRTMLLSVSGTTVNTRICRQLI